MEKIKQALEATTLVRNAIYEAYIALSALEGSQPKELTDEEIERMLIDVEVVLRESMELASPVARMVELDRYRTCLKQLRGMGYLSPPPKEQGAEPVPTAREKAMEEAAMVAYDWCINKHGSAIEPKHHRDYFLANLREQLAIAAKSTK